MTSKGRNKPCSPERIRRRVSERLQVVHTQSVSLQSLVGIACEGEDSRTHPITPYLFGLGRTPVLIAIYIELSQGIAYAEQIPELPLVIFTQGTHQDPATLGQSGWPSAPHRQGWEAELLY